MKRYGIAIAVLFFGVVLAAFSAENTYKFKVTGMHCDMCPKAVEKAAKSVKGVKEVELTLIEGKWQNGGELIVEADKTVTAQSIIKAIEKVDKAYMVTEVKP